MTNAHFKRMNEQAQQIAMLEACGWHRVESSYANGDSAGYSWVAPDGIGRNLPDYLRDLNAMHSAVMSRPIDWRMAFQNSLQKRATEKGKILIDLEASDWAECFLSVDRLNCKADCEGKSL